jgi:hypothetical protein
MSQQRRAEDRTDEQAEEQAEETAVPDIDIVGETVEQLSGAGARILLPHPHQRARPAEQPHHPEKEQEQEYHVGGARGPQDPGPWGSDEAIRNQPPWGTDQGNPMDEGSE